MKAIPYNALNKSLIVCNVSVSFSVLLKMSREMRIIKKRQDGYTQGLFLDVCVGYVILRHCPKTDVGENARG